MLLATSMTRTRKFASLSVRQRPREAPVVGWPTENVRRLARRQRCCGLGRRPRYAAVPRQLHADLRRAAGAVGPGVQPDFDALNRCRDRNVEAEVVEAVFVFLRVVQEVFVPVPLLLSTAYRLSFVSALDALTS